MSSALPLIVLGQVYLLVPASNIPPIQANSTSVPNIYPSLSQLSGPLPEATKHNSYTYVSGIGAYKFHTQAANWNTARMICREEGGHLAIINSRAESEALTEIFGNAGPHLDSYSSDNAWLGFHDLFGQQGRYETIYGEYVENIGFNEWRNGRRQNYGAFCGVMYKNGQLHYFGCQRLLAFVCELPHIQSYMEQTNSATITTV